MNRLEEIALWLTVVSIIGIVVGFVMAYGEGWL